MKRILVTGGAGFISSNMIRYLLEHTQHQVVTMDALTYAGNLENLDDVISHDRLRFIRGDIRDIHDVAEALDGVDVIVNAAAESHVSKSIEQGGAEFVTTNVVGTQVLLDAIRERPGGAVHPDLVVRGVRHGRERPDDRGSPAQPALALRGHQGRRRPPGLLVLVHV
jgi:dTDP-glucose 4,6-dehydratase